ncbi:transcriptional regulator [Iodidimonas gelatinilytica]|uniref:Transcriptional regulator n=2 Tax=Iodidimonas gelatinilytica TaxID=1236966 RepID=A0A5A7N0F0_9PROT|nr:transcriptional regulator [Iodidimonas gelatinilytica]GER01733.1 transcriptional regulator [Iodidimonas gelatinilytica]
MHEIDVRGLQAPFPILKIRRALAAMEPGIKIKAIADDPALIADLPAFCQQAGHRLIMAHQQGSQLIFELERGARQADLNVTEALQEAS